jgi:hypothetical protein
MVTVGTAGEFDASGEYIGILLVACSGASLFPSWSDA